MYKLMYCTKSATSKEKLQGFRKIIFLTIMKINLCYQKEVVIPMLMLLLGKDLDVFKKPPLLTLIIGIYQ